MFCLASALGEVHRETLEIGERAAAEGAFVSSPQDHAGRLARLQRFLPTGRTQAPTVAGPQAGKAEFGHRRRKIVAARFGKIEKHRSHHDADSVATNVLLPCVAAAVPIKPRHGGYGANIERLAKHVAGCPAPPASIATVVPQHRRLLLT